MIAALLGGISASPLARAALRYGTIALAIVLFLLALRRAGERAGRLAERLATTEKVKFNAGCWRLRLTVLAIATSWLTGCATEGFNGRVVATCPPVVDYRREFQARAAEELALLPDGSAVIEMMSDCTIMRDQARSCHDGG
jgi:hypothetical protein